MALTSAGLESSGSVVLCLRQRGDGCDQTTFSPILFPIYRGGRCRQGCIAFLSRHCQ